MTEKKAKVLTLEEALAQVDGERDSGGHATAPVGSLGASAPQAIPEASPVAAQPAADQEEEGTPVGWEVAFGKPEAIESAVAKDKFGFVPRSILDFSNDDKWQLPIPRELMAKVEHRRSFSDQISAGNMPLNLIATQFNSGLARFLLRYYTAPGDRILDPFAGWGTRAYVAKLLGRHYVGFDVAKTTVDAVNEALGKVQQAGLDDGVTGSAVVYLADGIACADVPEGSVDAILTCPPYADREVYEEADPSSGGKQLSRLDRGYFEMFMKRGFKRWYSLCRPGAMAIFIVSDWREEHVYYPFSHLMITWATEAGFVLHDFAIHRLRSLTAMGIGAYLKVRILPKSHEFVLVFKKPGGE